MGIIRSTTEALNRNLFKVVNKMTLVKAKPVVVGISSFSGAGTSTAVENVAEILRERGQTVETLNYTFTNLSQDLGIGFDEFRKLAEKDETYDFGIDLLIRRRAEKALSEGKSVVAGSRIADWALGGIADLYVWIDLDSEIRAGRIYQREKEIWAGKVKGAKPRYNEGVSLEEIKEKSDSRDADDLARYKRLYGIDLNDNSFCNLVLNSGKDGPEEIATKIYSKLTERIGSPKSGEDRWKKIEAVASKKYSSIEEKMGKVFEKYGVSVRGN